MTLKGAIVRAIQFWEHLLDVEDTRCPIQFDQTELDKFAENENDWLLMNKTVDQWQKRVYNMTEEG